MGKTVYLGKIPVGPDHPTLFLPEIGLYFGKDVGRARASIQKIVDAGCTVIKGEIAHTAEVVLDDGFIYEYVTHKEKRARPYRHIIEEIVLPADTWRELWRSCHDLGLASVISAYDAIGVDLVKDVGGSCIKIASNNLVNVPLIRYASKSGLSIMMDTGKASLEEVTRAVDTARQAGCDNLIVNHAPDGHPAAPNDHNLRIIETYERMFDCPIGLADHHVGEEIMYAATGMGYSVIEKPVVPVPEEVDVDAPWTMREDDVELVRQRIRACWESRGLTYRPKRYSAKDHPARMGMVTSKGVKAGDRADLLTVRFAWPQRGVSVYHWDLIDGAIFLRDLPPDTPIQWTDVKADPKT